MAGLFPKVELELGMLVVMGLMRFISAALKLYSCLRSRVTVELSPNSTSDSSRSKIGLWVGPRSGIGLRVGSRVGLLIGSEIGLLVGSGMRLLAGSGSGIGIPLGSKDCLPKRVAN